VGVEVDEVFSDDDVVEEGLALLSGLVVTDFTLDEDDDADIVVEAESEGE
jgi:hypothetical protein